MNTHGSGRRPGPGAEPGRWRPEGTEPDARQAGPAAAPGAGDAGCNGRRTRRITSFCHYVQHFTSPATAQQWTTAHPGTVVISLNDAAELARRHAARAFGAVSA